MTVPLRAAERVTWPEGCPVPVYRDTGIMVQALVLQRWLNVARMIPARKLDLPQCRCDPSTIADS